MKWFVVFSLAVHATVLTAWMQHELEASTSGRVLQLAITSNTSGAAPATAADIPAPVPAAESPPVQTRQQPRRQARGELKAQTPPPATRPVARPAATVAEDMPAPAAQATASTGSPTPGRQEIGRQLRASILELVATELKYPAMARRKGWQGTVQLELHIEPDGRISRLRINRTSGYPVLDNAATQALQLARLPQAGQWLKGQAIDLVVPVEYRLLDS